MIIKTITDDLGKTKLSINSGLKGLFSGDFFKQTSILSDSDITALKAYNAELEKVIGYEVVNGQVLPVTTSAQTAFNRTMQDASDTAVNMARAANGAAVNIEAIGTTSKAATVATKAFAVAGNMIAMWAISEVISLAYKAIGNYIHRIDNLKEAAEEAKSAIDDIKSKFENLTSTTNDVKERFAELAQGVENLGKVNQSRGTLSTDDYDEFLDLSNQLAELFPQLTKGYDDNGNAILDLSGDVNTIVGSLDNLVSVQQKLANQQILENMSDVWAGYTIDLDEYTEELDAAENKVNGFINSLSDIDYGVVKIKDSKTNIAIEEALKKALDIDWWNNGKLYQKSRTGIDAGTVTWDFSTLTKSQFEQLKNELGALGSEYEDAVQLAKNKIESANSEMSSYINTWLSSEWNYSKMSSGMQNVVKDILLNSDWINELPNGIDSGNWDEVSNWLQQEFLYSVNKIDSKEIQDSLINAFNDNLSVESVENLISQLTETEEFDEDNPLIVYLDTKLKDAETLQKQIDDVIQFTKDNFDGYDPTTFFEEHSINTQEEIDTWQKIAQAANSAADAEKKYLEDSTSNETTLSFTDAISQVESLSKGLDQLDKIYADVYDKEDFDWSSILNNDDFKETFGDMGASYEAFIKQISSTPDDIEACQKAFNDLVTAYLYAPDSEGNNWMKDLSESTKDATVAFLEQKGIVNALEIVENALLQKESALTDSKQTLAQMCSTLAQSVNSEAEAKRIAELESINLDNVTLGELDILIQEAQQLGINTGALINLKLAKFDVNRQSLNLNDDVSSLLAMAKAAGIATEATVKLASIQAGYQEAKRNNNEQAMRSIAVQMEGEKKNLEAEIANFSAPKVDFAGGSSTKPVIDKSTKEASDSAKSATAETIDFIEIAISRLEDAIDKTKSKAESAFRSFSTRNKAYSDAISKTTEKIKLQEQAYNAYMDRANSVGLDESWAKQVRDGSIIIADITDDTLKEQISDYTKWYNKARDCKTAIQDLKLEQKELVQANIDLLITKYDKLISKAESANERIQNKIDVKISWGGSASASDYTKMNTNLSKQISYITKQNKSLVDLQKTVTKGSEAWYEYNEQINSNKASLQELQKQMAENAQAAAALSKANADKKVEKYDSKDELNDAKIDNATTAKSKNSLINKKMSNINGRQKAYDNAVTTSTNRLNASIASINSLKSKKTNTKNKTANKENKTYNAVLKKVRAQIKAGKRIGTKLLNETTALNDNLALYNACVQYNAYLDAKAENETVAEIYAETAKQEKADLALEKFNNIATEYDYSTSANEQKKTELNNKISLAEAQGRKASIAYYNGLISAENGEQQKLIQKRNALQKSLDAAVANGQIEKGSEEWYEMVDAINEVTNSIDESVEKVVELNNAIRQIKWDTFDDSLETVKRIPGETDFYINFMSKNKDLTDEASGNFTEYGNAALALHNENYKNYLAQADAYAREYNDIMNQVARGELSLDDENVIQRLRELQDAQRDAKLSAEDELSAIIDLTRQGYEAQLNALSKLIQKYKDLKQNEKDAYEYQKSIAEKTKSIAALQKQLAAYGDNDTEEARAKIQQIKVDLEESKQDLKETEYEKYLSDTNDMLDEMYGDYEDFIDKRLKDTDAILEMINSSIEGMSSGIIATLASLNGGITPELEKLLSGSMSSSDYVNGVIASDKAKQEESMRAAEAQKAQEEQQKAEEERKNDEEAQRQKAYEAEKARSETNAKREELERQLESEKRNLVELQNKLADLKSDAQHELDAINAVRKKKGQNPLTSLSNVSGYTSRKQEVEAKIKTSKNKIASIQKQIDNLPQYGNGSNYIPYDQLAWTQEKGAEAILRKSDGALLTPLRMGDMVFDNETTHRLLELSSMNPVQLVNGINLTSIPPSLPVIERNVTGGNVSIDLGGINMYGVNDPETFGKQIREEICKNGKTLQCITEGVSSKITGKGTGSTRLFQ